MLGQRFCSETDGVTMLMLRSRGARCCIICALILCTVSVSRAQVSYTILGNVGPGPVVNGINASGQVVGSTFNSFSNGTQGNLGFLYSGGSFITLLPPGGVLSSAQAINASGQVVGWYTDSSGNFHGFLYSAGTFTTIDVPGSIDTQALGINDSGQIVGNFTVVLGVTRETHGFLLSGGNFTTIDAPGTNPNNIYTSVVAINNAGQLAGNFYGTNNEQFGFFYSAGTFTTITAPTGTTGAGTELLPAGINATGQVVGTYNGSNGTHHGFLFSGGVLSTIDPPFPNPNTEVTGINDSGQIVGFYQAPGTAFGFVLSAGIYVTLNPSEGVPGGYLNGFAYAINNAGQIAGTYDNSQTVPFVFLATLEPITFLDPVPNLLNGPAVTTDSGLLSAPLVANAISGVSADGVTQVVIRITAPMAGEQYTLTLLNDSNAQSNLPDEDGALANLGSSTFVQSQIFVTAESTVNGPMAFAIYRAPVDFARLLNTSDESAAKRSVSIQVLDNGTKTMFTVPFQIIRPPVALIHGLWSGPATWNEFAQALNSSSLFSIYRVDYQSSNFVQVQINERIALTQLGDFLNQFKQAQSVAAVQFDLVGHSMGGLISRYLVFDPRFYMDGNYKQGWTHKLITIDTPHAGSVVTALLDASGAACHAAYATANTPIDGATHDLEPNSALLQTVYSLPLPPTHAIAGYMTPSQDFAASSFVNGLVAPVLNLVCPTLFNAVTPFSFSGLYGGPNDIAVAESSQVYGFPQGLAVDLVPGVVHSGPTLPWLNQWAGIPPGSLSAGSGNPALVLNLLNTPPSSGAFRQGIAP